MLKSKVSILVLSLTTVALFQNCSKVKSSDAINISDSSSATVETAVENPKDTSDQTIDNLTQRKPPVVRAVLLQIDVGFGMMPICPNAMTGLPEACGGNDAQLIKKIEIVQDSAQGGQVIVYRGYSGKTTSEMTKLSNSAINAIAGSIKKVNADATLYDEDEGRPMCADAGSVTFSAIQDGKKVTLQQNSGCHTKILQDAEAYDLIKILDGNLSLARIIK